MSFCTSLLSKSDRPRQKKMTSCRFSIWRISAILDFKGPVMGPLKSPRTTSYRSSIETIVLNCLVFEKIVFFVLHFGDRQTDGEADRIKPLNHHRLLRHWQHTIKYTQYIYKYIKIEIKSLTKSHRRKLPPNSGGGAHGPFFPLPFRLLPSPLSSLPLLPFPPFPFPLLRSRPPKSS